MLRPNAPSSSRNRGGRGDIHTGSGSDDELPPIVDDGLPFRAVILFAVITAVLGVGGLVAMYPDEFAAMVETSRTHAYEPSVNHRSLPGVLAATEKKVNTHAALKRIAGVRSGSDTVTGKAAVGLMVDLDVIVHAHPLVNALGWGAKMAETKPVHHEVITTEEELRECFLFFLTAGAGAERYVTNREVFHNLVAVARSVDGASEDLGGNGAIMGNRLAKEGFKVLLGAPVGSSIKQFVEPGVEIVGGLADDVLEDVHLIIEYSTGDGWAPGAKSPRANRFIVTCDDHNPSMRSMEPFFKRVTAFRPDLLVISGFQQLDGVADKATRAGLLARLKTLTAGVRADTRIHFELASVSELPLMQQLVEIMTISDSIGMNEQELFALHHVITTGDMPPAYPSKPGVTEIIDMLVEAMDWFGARAKGSHHIDRLHLHTLAFQAGCERDVRSHRFNNIKRSLAAASLRATQHTCDSESIGVDRIDVLLPEAFRWRTGGMWEVFNEHNPVACFQPWTDQPNAVCCVAPNLVCKKPVVTVGAGDNISAAGLFGHWV